jgi:hypothetical protein
MPRLHLRTKLNIITKISKKFKFYFFLNTIEKRIMGEVMENLGDFRKSIQILTFLSPTTACSPTFQKTNVLHKDLERMQLTSLE